MGATAPEQVSELLEDAYRVRDVEAIADLYEDDAIFANPPAWTAIGRREIVERVSEMLGTMSSVETVYDPPEKSVVVGDYAFFHFTSRSQVRLADGGQQELRTRTTTIAHRGPDGLWRFVLDHNSAS
jgi:uncharacterized protein (TIGR02246 family)